MKKYNIFAVLMGLALTLPIYGQSQPQKRPSLSTHFANSMKIIGDGFQWIGKKTQRPRIWLENKAVAGAKAVGRGIQAGYNYLMPEKELSREEYMLWMHTIEGRLQWLINEADKNNNSVLIGEENTLRGKYDTDPQINHPETHLTLGKQSTYFNKSQDNSNGPRNPEFSQRTTFLKRINADREYLTSLLAAVRNKMHEQELTYQEPKSLDPNELAKAAISAASHEKAEREKAAIMAHQSGENIKNLVTSIPNLLSNPRVLGSILLLFGGGTLLYHGIPLLLVERPSVVTETSIRTIMDVIRGVKKQEAHLEKIVLSPENGESIRRQIIHDKRVAETGNGEYMNLCFYGPPGTGKTMTARAIARAIGADYMIINGAAFEQLSEGEIIKAINNIFRMARSSKKGVIIFIDEGEVVLGARGGGQETTKSRRVINGILGNITDTHDKKIKLVVATNIPKSLDKAILSRLPQEGWIYFGPPGYPEKFRILFGYLKEFADHDKITIGENFNEQLEAIVKTLPAASTGRDLRALARSVLDRIIDDGAKELTSETVITVLKEIEDNKKKFEAYSY